MFEDRSLVFHITDFDKMADRRRRRVQQNADTRLSEAGGLADYDVEPGDCTS